jgi:TetR/AcrR family transcriptional regulator
MARQRNERDSRSQIFAAAAAEFADRGFEAAGVDRIAARARVNKAMIYYHFRSKQGLYVEVLRDMFRAVGTRARAIADSADTAERKVDVWVATIIYEASQRPWFPPIMLRELASGMAHLDAETLGLLSVIFGAVRDMVVEGQQDGAFRDVDPLLTHLTIMPAVMAFFVRERALAKPPKGAALPSVRSLAAPRSREDFVHHMQQAVRGMLRKD